MKVSSRGQRSKVLDMSNLRGNSKAYSANASSVVYQKSKRYFSIYSPSFQPDPFSWALASRLKGSDFSLIFCFLCISSEPRGQIHEVYLSLSSIPAPFHSSSCNPHGSTLTSYREEYSVVMGVLVLQADSWVPIPSSLLVTMD
jgi:hypothetical protein